MRLLFTLLSLGILAAQDWSGTWKFYANSAGADRAMLVQLRQSGTHITGTIDGTSNSIEGVASGRSLEFTRFLGPNRTPQRYKGYLFQSGAPPTAAGTFSHENEWAYGWYAVRENWSPASATPPLPATPPATAAPAAIPLAGNWSDDANVATVSSDAVNNLIFTNRYGQRSRGRLVNATTVLAIDWEGGLRGTLAANGNTILWANRTVWYRLAGNWSDEGRTATVTHDAANNLTFTNRYGQRSRGRLADATTVIAIDWEGGLRGRLTNQGATIQWANGTDWHRP